MPGVTTPSNHGIARPTRETLAAGPVLRRPLRSPAANPQLLSRRQITAEKRAIRVGVGLSLVWLASFAIGFKTTVALLTVAGFTLAAIGLQWPMYGLVGIGILCSIDAVTRVFLMTGGLFRYNTFNYWLLFVIFYTFPMQLRQRDIHTWLMRIFAALLIVELAWTLGFKGGILNIMNFVTVFGLYAYFYRCRDNPRMWFVLALTVGLSSALGGVAFFLNQNELSFVTAREEYLRKDIFDRNYIDPNALCYFFLTAIFSLSLGLTSNTAKKGREETMLYGLLAINICFTFLVGSRGGILVASAAPCMSSSLSVRTHAASKSWPSASCRSCCWSMRSPNTGIGRCTALTS